MLGFISSKYGMWAVGVGLLASGLACSGGFEDELTSEEGNEAEISDEDVEVAEGAEADENVELGQAQQAWWWSWRPSFSSSCSDSTGTDSVLAAIAVATAQELRRWQPLVDFKVSNSMLVLTDVGKARCADRTCFNTQALLDFQKDGSNAQVRPGVRVSPSGLRSRLTKNWQSQKNCSYLWSIFGCKAPDHEFKFLHTEPGGCDQNFWFEVRTPLGALLSASGLKDLKEKLVWVDEDDNEYIQFQTSGNNVAIDPTYGLNHVSSTATGTCAAACVKISSTNVAGQCCSCNGTRKYARSAWNTSTYICQ